MSNVEDMPLTAPQAGDARRRLAATRFVRQATANSRYLISSFPYTVAQFVVVYVLFTLGVSAFILVAGIPILVGAIYTARFFADAERSRLAAVLHRPAPRPRYRRAPHDVGAWRRLVTPLGETQSWLDVIHALFAWITSTIGFSVVVTWWASAFGGLTYFGWARALPDGGADDDLNRLIGLPETYPARVLVYLVIGVLFLVTLPPVARFFALLHAGFSWRLLCGVADMQERIIDLSERSVAAVSAEAAALRRLERDIHDGPQQRLVRLAMDLGRTRQLLESDPLAARGSIDEALGQARDTLHELRALSRGIAPPVLADRGLPGALTALAGRCTVPVQLNVDVSRLSAMVENTAYFVVAEALTNIAKHSQARSCSVRVSAESDQLQVIVEDDGIGGAHVAKGHGLAGLADRVRAAGGTLTITSAGGGPTRLHAVLPYG